MYLGKRIIGAHLLCMNSMIIELMIRLYNYSKVFSMDSWANTFCDPYLWLYGSVACLLMYIKMRWYICSVYTLVCRCVLC